MRIISDPGGPILSETEVDTAYWRNHRHQQFLALAIVLVALFLSIAPRQERSLFIVPGAGLKGFGAIVPMDESRLPWFPWRMLLDFPPAGYFVRVPGVPGIPGGVPFTPADVTPGAPVAGAATPSEPAAPPGALPSPLTPAAAGAPSGGFPFAPPSLAPATASPAGQPTAPGPPTAADVPPIGTIPAVPEPATWLMMLIGFLVAGVATRRGMRARANARVGASAQKIAG